MKTQPFKILVLDDNYFYSKLIQRQIRRHINSIDSKLAVEINSHVDIYSFMNDLADGVNVAIIDYFLGQGMTGMHAMKQVFKQNKQCAIAIMSGAQHAIPRQQLIQSGASEFILKTDKYSLARACQFAEKHTIGVPSY